MAPHWPALCLAVVLAEVEVQVQREVVKPVVVEMVVRATSYLNPALASVATATSADAFLEVPAALVTSPPGGQKGWVFLFSCRLDPTLLQR